MTPAEPGEKASWLSRYGWCILLLFLLELLVGILDEANLFLPRTALTAVGQWAVRLIVAPFVLAGVIGCIRDARRTETAPVGGFLHNAVRHYLRFVCAVFLCQLLFVLSFFVLAAVLGGFPEGGPGFSLRDKVILWSAGLPVFVLELFWFVAVVVDGGRMWRGLWRSVRSLLAFRLLGLPVAVAWGCCGIVDSALADVVRENASPRTVLAVVGARAAVMAFAAVVFYSAAVAIYRKTRVEVFGEPPEAPVEAPPPIPAEDRLARAGFSLAFASFLPPFNLAALTLGAIALRRRTRARLRAATACCLGGFFTAVYLLAAVGYLLPRGPLPEEPGLRFLSELDPRLDEHVALIEKRRFREAREGLDKVEADPKADDTALRFARAVVKAGLGDHDGAKGDFRGALAGEPERSEFYHLYGLYLLKRGEGTEAAANLRRAMGRPPRTEAARRHLSLALNVWKPSRVVKAVLLVAIVIVLLTVHEYAHAYAAWKLGDDTAKERGRVSLNPLAHLSLFGSVILPGILLWRESGVVFGWGKPVPVNPENLADPRRDHMLISFAGPAANLVVAMIAFVLLALTAVLTRALAPDAISLNLAAPGSAVYVGDPNASLLLVRLTTFLKHLMYTGVVLACFNLIPVPPLDGSWILSGILSDRARAVFDKLRRYSFLFVLVIVLTPALDIVLAIPIGLAWGMLHAVFAAMGFR